jgi:hypothetical protein
LFSVGGQTRPEDPNPAAAAAAAAAAAVAADDSPFLMHMYIVGLTELCSYFPVFFIYI